MPFCNPLYTNCLPSFGGNLWCVLDNKNLIKSHNHKMITCVAIQFIYSWYKTSSSLHDLTQPYESKFHGPFCGKYIIYIGHNDQSNLGYMIQSSFLCHCSQLGNGGSLASNCEHKALGDYKVDIYSCNRGLENMSSPYQLPCTPHGWHNQCRRWFCQGRNWLKTLGSFWTVPHCPSRYSEPLCSQMLPKLLQRIWQKVFLQLNKMFIPRQRPDSGTILPRLSHVMYSPHHHYSHWQAPTQCVNKRVG